MDVLERDTVIELARHFDWPAVSIYMPTHRARAEAPQDPIRLKNLIKTAEEELAAQGVRSSAIGSILEPARMLLEDSAFWRNPADGLAIFAAEGVYRTFLTDVAMTERVAVGDRFHVRPLLPALHGEDHFYVLALSKNRVRLLRGTRRSVDELDLASAPASLADALRYDDYERQVQFHTRTPAAAAGRGARTAVFHGHGGLPDVAKDNLLRYFRAIDRGIRDSLHGHAPLVLAGVEYLLPIYREANTYPNLAGEAMRGNPDDLSPEDLHAEAIRALEPHFRGQLDADLAERERLAGTRSSSADLSEIVTAAHEGRVKVLFVSDRATDWGSFDPASGRVDVHDDRRPGDRDLTDLAAAETLLHGGVVHALAAQETAPSAIFRY